MSPRAAVEVDFESPVCAGRLCCRLRPCRVRNGLRGHGNGDGLRFHRGPYLRETEDSVNFFAGSAAEAEAGSLIAASAFRRSVR